MITIWGIVYLDGFICDGILGQIALLCSRRERAAIEFAILRVVIHFMVIAMGDSTNILCVV